MAKRSRRTAGTMPQGWWDENVPAHLDPVEVVAHLERIRPDHPALQQLRKIAQGYAGIAAHVLEEPLLRCPTCKDRGVVELKPGTTYKTFGASSPGTNVSTWTPDELAKHIVTEVVQPGRLVVSRCKGPHGNGCPYDQWRREQAAERASEKRQRRQDGEPGSL